MSHVRAPILQCERYCSTYLGLRPGTVTIRTVAYYTGYLAGKAAQGIPVPHDNDHTLRLLHHCPILQPTGLACTSSILYVGADVHLLSTF